jgi:hypothetical protein
VYCAISVIAIHPETTSPSAVVGSAYTAPIPIAPAASRRVIPAGRPKNPSAAPCTKPSTAPITNSPLAVASRPIAESLPASVIAATRKPPTRNPPAAVHPTAMRPGSPIPMRRGRSAALCACT